MTFQPPSNPCSNQVPKYVPTPVPVYPPHPLRVAAPLGAGARPWKRGLRFTGKQDHPKRLLLNNSRYIPPNISPFRGVFLSGRWLEGGSVPITAPDVTE